MTAVGEQENCYSAELRAVEFLDPVMVEFVALWTRILPQICGVCSATPRKHSLCLNWSWTAGKTAL